jgi:hypothetical protein
LTLIHIFDGSPDATSFRKSLIPAPPHFVSQIPNPPLRARRHFVSQTLESEPEASAPAHRARTSFRKNPNLKRLFQKIFDVIKPAPEQYK